MRLLILTQKVDKNDPILGFFHRWIEEFAKKCEKVTVICLFEGSHSLPANVRVLSLGKEKGLTRLGYIKNFYKYIWQERNNYDKVFVHMNQEYILLGGIVWNLLGKKVFMWRNHAQGDWKTNIVGIISTKVFCTTSKSYVATFSNAVIMPVGIDTDLFKSDPSARTPNSILVLGRVAPVKKVKEIVESFAELKKRGVIFKADIVGDALPRDLKYYYDVRNLIMQEDLSDSVKLLPAVPQHEAAKLFPRYEMFINLTPDGSLDKTIFEALASGCTVVVANTYFDNVLPYDPVVWDLTAQAVATKMEDLMSLDTNLRNAGIQYVKEHHDLGVLMARLQSQLSEDQ